MVRRVSKKYGFEYGSKAEYLRLLYHHSAEFAEKKRERNRRWCRENQEQNRANVKRAQTKLRLQVLLKYSDGGLRCACPNCSDTNSPISTLQIEHVNGGGRRAQREAGDPRNLYRSLLSTHRDDIIVLCSSCNFAKQHRHICPHNDPGRQQHCAEAIQAAKEWCDDPAGKALPKGLIRKAALIGLYSGWAFACACSLCRNRRGNAPYLLDELTLDHINGDGASERRKTRGHNRGHTELLRLWRGTRTIRTDLQVLCAGCNKTKGQGSICACHPDHELEQLYQNLLSELKGVSHVQEAQQEARHQE